MAQSNLWVVETTLLLTARSRYRSFPGECFTPPFNFVRQQKAFFKRFELANDIPKILPLILSM